MDNAQSGNVDNAEETADKKKTKRDKVRSAWISFAGRIVAQIVGAIATVALGVVVLHRYTSTETRPRAAEVRHDAYTQSGRQPAASAPHPIQPPVTVIVITPAMLGFRDVEETGTASQNCRPTLDSAAPSTAHLNSGTYLSR